MKKNSVRVEASMKNLDKALAALKKSVESPITEARDLSGIIKDFEMVYELSWKTLKKFLEESGNTTGTAREVFVDAFSAGVIGDQDLWLAMIQDRNLAVHTYDEKLARELVSRIQKIYMALFDALAKRLKE